MQLALLISVIVALILSAFLLLVHTQSFFRIKSDEIIQGYAYINQHLNKKQNFQGLIWNDTLITETDLGLLKSNYTFYGGFIKSYASLTIKNRSISKSTLMGGALNSSFPNLYLTDKNSPLVLVGNTKLKGNIHLPEQGIKAGTIAGVYYRGTDLYSGKAIRSADKLPAINKSWIDYIENLTSNLSFDQKDWVPLEKVVKNSFLNSPKLIYQEGTISLDDQELSGNIILRSDTKIHVYASARLTDVILIAPEITIDRGVEGSIQIIATKSIKINSQSKLNYPSSILIYNKDRNSTHSKKRNDYKPAIYIDKNTRIEGIIGYFKKYDKITSPQFKDLIIANQAKILGQIYCQGNLEYAGQLKGSLFTDQFTTTQSGSIYVNHLLNAEVAPLKSNEYAGLLLDDSPLKVVKWLY